MVTRAWGGEWMKWVKGVKRYKLTVIKVIKLMSWGCHVQHGNYS